MPEIYSFDQFMSQFFPESDPEDDKFEGLEKPSMLVRARRFPAKKLLTFFPLSTARLRQQFLDSGSATAAYKNVLFCPAPKLTLTIAEVDQTIEKTNADSYVLDLLCLTPEDRVIVERFIQEEVPLQVVA